ncbi:MAG: negative regulator of sigma E activity, partial [Myxococcota bacterium]
MVDLYEQLSQLMDGDLSVDDAAALRKRIANDSEV